MVSDSLNKANAIFDFKKLDVVAGNKSSARDDLVDMFFNNVTECIEVLERSEEIDDQHTWSKAVNDLKQISDVIGAKNIADICTSTQQNSVEKKLIINNIQKEVKKLQSFIRNTSY